MRGIRQLPLAAPLLLTGLALFFGGGPADSSVFWLGGLALLALLALLASEGVPGGWEGPALLALLAVWCAISIAWSWLPDRSWDYANRTLVYAALAAAGLWAAGRTRGLALGLAVLLGAVIGWSLLGKVLPPVYDYGGLDVTRLRGPIGLWNQLALATDYALVLALAFRRRGGTLLAYVALVALLLTYSRGGVLTAVVVCAAWFLLAEERVDGAVTLLSAAVPAAVVVTIAFVLPGVTSDSQSLHVRWRDGLVFGAVLLAGAAVSLALLRVPRPRDARVVRRAALALVAAAIAGAVAFVAVHGIGSATVGNSGGRFGSTSSNFRFTWWDQAWRGFLEHPLAGVGAGAFHVLNLRFRSTYLDFTIEPHNLPVQLLAEVGIVGLVLFAAACAFLIRPSLHRRGHELALALLLPAFLVHALVDVDWDFLAVTAPALVAAGALAGRPARAPARGLALLPATGVALVLFGAFVSPWLARRWALDAYGATSSRALDLADRAHSFDPLLLDPYWAKASALDDQGRTSEAFAQYVAAVHRQPKNAQSWLAAGWYAWHAGCPYQAYVYLEKYTELDQKARPSQGGDLYNEALRRVNNAQYRC
ncbi:MAG TPA: O-antigen ligase family protein [Gaiellaceae bacterium]|nr:O-antigen ligase family protein [Gaiellaceae bacterium]